MKLKRRSKRKNSDPVALKRRDENRLRRRPKKRYTKGGHFIIEDKHWRERYVPCCECRYWNESSKIYIAEDGTEGWICPRTDKPRLHNEFVVCRYYTDNWVAVRRKGVVTKVRAAELNGDVKLKRRRRKKNGKARHKMGRRRFKESD